MVLFLNEWCCYTRKPGMLCVSNQLHPCRIVALLNNLIYIYKDTICILMLHNLWTHYYTRIVLFCCDSITSRNVTNICAIYYKLCLENWPEINKRQTMVSLWGEGDVISWLLSSPGCQYHLMADVISGCQYHLVSDVISWLTISSVTSGMLFYIMHINRHR